MGGLVKGDVVVIHFPFSDFTAGKKRPALVIRKLAGDDVMLCQITSKFLKDKYSVEISPGDFSSGQLREKSHVRIAKIFTCDANLILIALAD